MRTLPLLHTYDGPWLPPVRPTVTAPAASDNRPGRVTPCPRPRRPVLRADRAAPPA